MAINISAVTGGLLRQGDLVTLYLSTSNNAGGKTLSCPSGAITVASQDAESISFSLFDLKSFGDKKLNYNTNIPITVTDGADTSVINFQITPDTDVDYGQITALTGVYADDLDVAVNDWSHGRYTAGSGTFNIATGMASQAVHSRYKYWNRNDTTGVWSDPITEVLLDPTGTYVNVTLPIDVTDGSIFFEYGGQAPVVSDNIIHDPTTSPSGIAVTIDGDGIWNLASTPTSDQTIASYVLHANGLSSDKATISFTADIPDVTAPVLTLPTDTSTGTTTASGTVTTDEANGTLFFIASTNATETVAIIKAGSSQSVSTSGIQNVTFTGLTETTTYFAHFVHTDAAGNNSNVSNATGFVTDSTPDTTAPILTLPTSDRTGQESGAGSITTDEAGGTLYFVVTGNTGETAVTIKAGSQQAVATSGIQNVAASGLTPGATYYIHFVQVDASGNESTVVSSTAFTTDSSVGLVITAASEVRLGNAFTITTTGTYDLTAAFSITATLEGITLTGLANITASTCDFNCPASGFSLVSPSDLILTINI
jgi:hypothetical protein